MLPSSTKVRGIRLLVVVVSCTALPVLRSPWLLVRRWCLGLLVSNWWINVDTFVLGVLLLILVWCCCGGGGVVHVVSLVPRQGLGPLLPKLASRAVSIKRTESPLGSSGNTEKEAPFPGGSLGGDGMALVGGGSCLVWCWWFVPCTVDFFTSAASNKE